MLVGWRRSPKKWEGGSFERSMEGLEFVLLSRVKGTIKEKGK
jgi:hypothetical protein